MVGLLGPENTLLTLKKIHVATVLSTSHATLPASRVGWPCTPSCHDTCQSNRHSKAEPNAREARQSFRVAAQPVDISPHPVSHVCVQTDHSL